MISEGEKATRWVYAGKLTGSRTLLETMQVVLVPLQRVDSLLEGG